MFAIDIDGTICDTAAMARQHLRAALKLDLPGRTSMARLYDGVPPERQAEAYEALRDAFSNDAGRTYSGAQPFPHASTTVGWLARRNMARAYITHRPPHLQRLTEAWLRAFGFPTLPVVHADDKVDAMRRHRCSAIIEDSVDVGAAAAKRGHGVILTADAEPAAFPHLRMPSWDGLYELLRNMPLDYRQKFERGF